MMPCDRYVEVGGPRHKTQDTRHKLTTLVHNSTMTVDTKMIADRERKKGGKLCSHNYSYALPIITYYLSRLQNVQTKFK